MVNVAVRAVHLAGEAVNVADRTVPVAGEADVVEDTRTYLSFLDVLNLYSIVLIYWSRELTFSSTVIT